MTWYRKASLVFCLGLILGAGAVAQQPKQPAQATPSVRQQPPPPGPIRPFEFPKYLTRKLSNGLTVFVIEDHRQPVVSYELVVDAGGAAHSVKKAGLASMTAQLLREGTKTRSAQDIARTIDSVGGALTTSADDDTVQASATVMKTSEALGIELLADVVVNPVFKQEEIDRRMRQTLSGLQIQYTDAEYLAPVSAARVIFGEHPYGYPAEGTPETLAGIKREDIVQFHGRYYSPAGAFLAIAGDVKPEEAFANAEKVFGKWNTSASAPDTLSPIPASKRAVLIIDKPDAVQTQIVVGQTGIKRSDPDYIPLLIANQIFGGSYNSRLNLKLRAREGLTYGARSNFDTERVSGTFRVSTSTRTAETARATSMLLDLLKEFRQNPVTDAELKEAKAYLTGSFALGSETPQQVATRVLTAAVHGLPSNYWDTYREKVQAATPEQIADAVRRRIDPEKVSIVVVGNSKDFAKSLESFGTARTILFSDLDFTRPDLRRAK